MFYQDVKCILVVLWCNEVEIVYRFSVYCLYHWYFTQTRKDAYIDTSILFSLLYRPPHPLQYDLVYIYLCKQIHIRPPFIRHLQPEAWVSQVSVSFQPLNHETWDLFLLFLISTSRLFLPNQTKCIWTHHFPLFLYLTPFKSRPCFPSHLCRSMIPPSPLFLLTCFVPSVTTLVTVIVKHSWITCEREDERTKKFFKKNTQRGVAVTVTLFTELTPFYVATDLSHRGTAMWTLRHAPSRDVRSA